MVFFFFLKKNRAFRSFTHDLFVVTISSKSCDLDIEEKKAGKKNFSPSSIHCIQDDLQKVEEANDELALADGDAKMLIGEAFVTLDQERAVSQLESMLDEVCISGTFLRFFLRASSTIN